MSYGWTQISSSEYPWEQEALDYLKERLPGHEPYRGWANFEFILDGTFGEVDALLVAPKGVFLVEIKSWPGRIEGDAGTWRWTPPGETSPRPRDNPLLLCNRKAKRLKSLLGRQKAFRGKRVPFITPLVFLSHPELDCRLSGDGRHGITGLDRKNGETPQRGGLPGIIETVVRITSEEHAALGARRIDRPMAKTIAAALEQAGIRPSQRRREVAELELGELLDEGPGYQDYVGTHRRFPGVQHRVRIYGTSDVASSEDRERALRAAQREYELLAAISHPGIIRAQSFHEHELGPVIVFERDPAEVRLDHFLQQRGSALDVAARFEFVRELAETVAYAHGRRLFHRALSPRSVMVMAPGTPQQRLAIMNWQTGTRAGATSLSSISGTQHPEQLVDDHTAAYLAPEALTQPDADPELIDVFSLGAVAFQVFTSRAPAATLAGLVDVLQRDGALEVSAVLDGAGFYLAELVRDATAADATYRTASVADFIEGLALVEDEITAPQKESAAEEITPQSARKGDVIGGHTVVTRLGHGSTAIAFLVEEPSSGQRRVLKVADEPDHNDRLSDECEVLAKLRDRTIVAIFGEPVDVAGHQGIVLAYASEGTLRQHLHKEGRLGLERLQTWGDDLLSAVTYLEQEGIPHRDIKPENLGIMEVGKHKHRRLVLMDFSLSRAPADQIHAGTRPYLDPFLETDHNRRRFDLAAERFAAAMVLYEMATGALPQWGDGADPRFTDSEVTIDADTLPRQIARPLADFFERALRRDASDRFDTADDMLRAWRRIFEAATETPAPEGEGEPEAEAMLQAATRETPVAALGFSARGADALERLGILTAGDLVDINPIRINRQRGVGLATRRELIQARRELRARLGGRPREPAAITTDVEGAPDVQGLDELVAQLIPRADSRNRGQVAGLRALLGLDELDSRWPTQADVAKALDVTRARVSQIVTKGRGRWLRLPAVTRLREELCTALAQLGGVATVTELERIVIADRGAADEEGAPALARAAVRAAVEAELARDNPRLAQRRAGDRVLLASAGRDVADRQACLDYAVALGGCADRLATAEPLPASAEVRAALRDVRRPEPLGGLTAERLVRLAAEASTRAAVSGGLELYPRGLAAGRALTLARAALIGPQRLTAHEIRSRVSSRFPEAERLPDPPKLDALLEAAGIQLDWDRATEAYTVPEREVLTDVTSHVSSVERLSTAAATIVPRPTDSRVTAAQAFEERLEAALATGGLLALMTAPKHLEPAARELGRFAIEAVDMDRLLLDRLHETADFHKVRWDLVLRADSADRASVEWQRLLELVRRALPRVEEEIAGHEGTVLLSHLGLLARYGQLGLVERLRERIMAGGPLRGCWLLVPADQQSARPTIEGAALPLITANEWARIPKAWLENLHRAEAANGGQAA